MPFFLVLVGCLLIIFNLKAIKKDNTSFKEMIKHHENEITDFDVAIGELRREFSETILELQQEIYSLNEKLNAKVSGNNERKLTIENELQEKLIEDQVEQSVENTISDESHAVEHNGVRVKEIGEMIKQGISLEDICEKYNIGKGEVLLIRELYLR
jgi:regulator of replication initiation timing